MSEVEKLEALLAKVQANRQLPREGRGEPLAVSSAAVSGAASGTPAPLASRTPISVAPPPTSAVASEPPAIASEPPAFDSEPPTMVSEPPAVADANEPSIEIGEPGDLVPEPVALPQVLAGSASPWEVVGTPVLARPTPTFVALLEQSLSLKPR